MSGPAPVQRTALQLYRDCLRLVRHVAPGYSPKAIALRATVQTEFRKNMNLTDKIAIENAKAGAVRALANYMLFESGAKDAQVSKAMSNFHSTSVAQAKEEQINREMNKNNDKKDS